MVVVAWHPLCSDLLAFLNLLDESMAGAACRHHTYEPVLSGTIFSWGASRTNPIEWGASGTNPIECCCWVALSVRLFSNRNIDPQVKVEAPLSCFGYS